MIRGSVTRMTSDQMNYFVSLLGDIAVRFETGVFIHATTESKWWNYSEGFYCIAPLLTS